MASRKSAVRRPQPSTELQSANIPEIATKLVKFLLPRYLVEGWTLEQHLDVVRNRAERGLNDPTSLKEPPITFFNLGKTSGTEKRPDPLDDSEEARFTRAAKLANDALAHMMITFPKETEASRAFADAVKSLTPQGRYAVLPEIERQAKDWFQSNFGEYFAYLRPQSRPAQSSIATAPTRAIEPSEKRRHGPTMQRETTFTVQGKHYKATTTVEADSYPITGGGVMYVPFALAAVGAQTTEKNLRDWIKKNIKFDGRPIRTYRVPETGKLYVSEESVSRMAQRFVKWPSNKRAGPLTIGHTDDQSGYLGLPDAARILAVDHHTVWRWITRGTLPANKPLDVIKCTTSDHLYIRENDIYELKAMIPPSGLRRGRRPQATLRP